MCADDTEGIVDMFWGGLYNIYKSLKRWYTGITRNCDCKYWRKKDHCHYYYAIYPSVHEMPRCKGWKVCPQCIETHNFCDYENIPATTRFKKKLNNQIGGNHV
jgi:hypothetical protein